MSLPVVALTGTWGGRATAGRSRSNLKLHAACCAIRQQQLIQWLHLKPDASRTELLQSCYTACRSLGQPASPNAPPAACW